MKKILIIEDSKSCAFLAASAVSKFASCQTVDCLKKAREILAADNEWDLILLDIELLDGSGLDYCCELQSDPELCRISVIFVSSYAEVEKKIMAFSLGAQDYLVKPYNLAELQARVNRIINPVKNMTSFLSFGDLKLSVNQLYVITKDSEGEKKVELSPKEYLLLKFMITHPDRVLSRQYLLETVWGDDINVIDRTVDSHIYSLRQKLKGLSNYITSVRGMGYQFAKQQVQMKSVA